MNGDGTGNGGPAAESGGPGRPGPGATGPSLSKPSPGEPSPSEAEASEAEASGPQLRVTTLELFFDLVFAFTLTQLAALLASRFSLTAGVQVLLVFGLLWWMYEAYAWLTNARPPVHTTERLLLLVAMAGFLVIGLAIPDGFGDSALALGLGYLTVVVIHAWLYFRVNANIIRVAPFNLASAVLVTVASLLRQPSGAERPAGYALWAAALAVQLGSPLIVHPSNRFELRPSHLAERHGALILVALGESVVAIGAGATRTGPVNARLAVAAVLGLALAAAFWWAIFGGGEQEESERILTAIPSVRRTALALYAFFYGNIPVLLGVIAVAAAIRQEVSHASVPAAGSVAAAAALGAGTALFLAGGAAVRSLLGIGLPWPRVAGAAAALATTPIGAFAGIEAQLAVVILVFVVLLVLERRLV